MVARAQGTIEYLVIIAVVVVLALVVVGILVSQTGSAGNISASVSKIGSSSGSISVSEAVIDVDGNGLITLSNNSGGVLVVTNLGVNGVDSDYPSVSMVQGDKKIFSLNSIGTASCSCVGFLGKKKTCSVIVYAQSEYGLQKQFTTTVSVDCVSIATAKSASAVVQYVPVLPYIFYPVGSKLYIHPIDSASAGWGCYGTAIGAGAQSGTSGSANTIAIVAGCAEAGIAAKLCSDLNFGGYDDWYLPASAQLAAVYVEIAAGRLYKGDYAAQWAGFVANVYWSSTEYSVDPANKAMYVNFNIDNGGVYPYNKYNGKPVRCVRGG